MLHERLYDRQKILGTDLIVMSIVAYARERETDREREREREREQGS